MKKRRYWLKLLFIVGICLMCRQPVVYGQYMSAQQWQNAQTPLEPKQGSVSTDGNCEFDDEARKNSAQQAVAALPKAINALIGYNNKLKQIWDNSDGACNFLAGTSITKRWKEALTDSLKFSDLAMDGAKAIDKNQWAKLKQKNGDKELTIAEVVNNFNQRADRTDWNINAISRRIQKGANNIKSLQNFLMTSKKGSEFEIDEAASEILEQVFNFKADCSKVIVIDDKQNFVCYQNMISGSAFASNPQDFAQKMQSGAAVAAMVECPEALKDLAKTRDDITTPYTEAAKILATLSEQAEVTCTCESQVTNGKVVKTDKIKECMAKDDEFVEDTVHSECPTIAQYQAKMGGSHCIVCNLFHTILLAVQNIAQKAFDSLAGPLRSLVSIGFGLYIAYITLIAVATPATQKISQYLTNLSSQGFKVAIALVLLANPNSIYNLAIGPLIDGGVEFGITLTGEDKAKIQDFGKTYTFADETDTYLKAEVLQNAVGAAAAFNDAAVRIPAIGRSMMCNAFVEKHFEIFPQFKMLTIGVIFYIFGLLIAFAIGFYMLDCALQLGIVCAMIPFFIACWPFKLTKSYTKQGWDIFLNTFFNFVIMGVVITASSEIMQQAISTGLSAETLETYLNSNNIEELTNELDFGGMQMVMLVICCLIAFKLAGEVQNITNKLSGGLGINAGAQIGSTISSTVNKAAAGAAATAWTGVKGAAGTMAESSGLAGGARALKGAVGNGLKNVGGALGVGSKAKAGGIADTAGKGLNKLGNAAEKVGMGKIASAAHRAGNALESVGKGRNQGGSNDDGEA